MTRIFSGGVLLLLLALLMPTGQAVQVRVRPSVITNARLGCEYRLVCEVAEVSIALRWLRNGVRVQNGSRNIRVTEEELGNMVRRTELVFSPLTSDQLGTYKCLVEQNQVTTYNGRIDADEESQPINIMVAGSEVKNISSFRMGEMRDIGCTVDSCLTSQYTVRFLGPRGEELRNYSSTAMRMTFNWQALITRDLVVGNYTCEVMWDGGMNDSAVFQFEGTPMEGATRVPPEIPCPTPDRAWPASISMVVCVTSFLLAIWLR